MRPSAPLLLLLLALGVSVRAGEKEFADCGSTKLIPKKLEVDPDPAEVSASEQKSL